MASRTCTLAILRTRGCRSPRSGQAPSGTWRAVVSTWSILGASYRDRTGAQGDALTPWRGYRARWRLAECLVEGGLDEADVGDPWRARGVHGSVRAPIWWRRRRGRNQSRHHHGYHL